MNTLLEKDFVLIAPYMEIEEVPAPGTSPNAPGGTDADRDDDGKDDDLASDGEWNDEDEEPYVDGFDSPAKSDPMM